MVANSYKLIVGLWHFKKIKIFREMMNMDRYIVQKLTVTIKRVKRMLLTSNTHHQIWTVYNPINRINHTRINPNHHRVFYQRTLVDIVQSYSNPKISFNEPARIQPHYQLKKSAKMFTCRKSPGSIQGIILSTIPKTLWSCWLSKMCSKEHYARLTSSTAHWMKRPWTLCYPHTCRS